MQMTMDERPVVVFDGVCNICARGVSFILAPWHDHLIRFAAAGVGCPDKLLLELGFDPQNLTTFVFIKGGVVYVRSDAAIEVAAHHLRLPWRMFCAPAPSTPAVSRLGLRSCSPKPVSLVRQAGELQCANSGTAVSAHRR